MYLGSLRFPEIFAKQEQERAEIFVEQMFFFFVGLKLEKSPQVVESSGILKVNTRKKVLRFLCLLVIWHPFISSWTISTLVQPAGPWVKRFAP